MAAKEKKEPKKELDVPVEREIFLERADFDVVKGLDSPEIPQPTRSERKEPRKK